MKKTLLILGVAAGVLFASCGQSGETNTVATDEAGQAAESVTVEKTIDLSASSVQWTGRKILDGMHTGTVAISQGSIAMNGSAIESGNFVLDMSTLKEKNGSDEAMLLLHHPQTMQLCPANQLPQRQQQQQQQQHKQQRPPRTPFFRPCPLLSCNVATRVLLGVVTATNAGIRATTTTMVK